MRITGAAVGIAASLIVMGATTGCATKKYVRTETGNVATKMDEQVTALETQIEDAQNRLENHDKALTAQGVEIEKVSGTAMDALERAKAAGKLAEGKLLYEVVLNSDKVTFDFEKSDLTDPSKQALDEFASQLKNDNKNVYIEIQGHTDSSGEEDYNHSLGEQRAAAVQRYLNMEHGIPLHRMSVISYGESAPLVDNDSREHRAENRRVALVVLM
jgi:outer membrane protein OmpA-like peptidoglycan-associated protein